MKIDYLVGGLRISTSPDSTTPGPRTHILGFTNALKNLGSEVDTHLASDFPKLGKFKNVKQSDYKGASSLKLIFVDIARIGIGIYSGLITRHRCKRSKQHATVIYERIATYQSLSSFHPRKKQAIRVVESNGILSRESVNDRKVVKLGHIAASIERHTLRKADLVVSVSDALADEIVAFANIDRNKILTLPNGAKSSLFDLPRSPSERIRIGFVGSITPWHHLDDLLESWSDIKSYAKTDIQLEIIGDGPELSNLQKLADKLNLGEEIIFHGRMSNDKAIDIMKGWRIGFAGHEKSSSQSMYHSPLKLYEYAALGLSIVCTPSADALSLQESGAKLHIFDPDALGSRQRAFQDAIVETMKLTENEVHEIRGSLKQAHSWETRAQHFTSKIEALVGKNRIDSRD